MRLLPLLFLSSAAIGTASAAAGPPPSIAANLRATLHSMMASAQAGKQIDHDQGDDHAALRAILVVCNHDNPSAERSAICPAPISPS
ncbi:MAG TPA: hypothetical protein VNS53_00145 [Sphingomicrobium sp.]|jgi:hypothetical protein|nr:hypothetical protein [Sphingomicrobium sp.]